MIYIIIKSKTKKTKKSTTKINTQNNRVCFISSSIDDDLSTLNNFFQDNKPSFIDKIYNTKKIKGEISTYLSISK